MGALGIEFLDEGVEASLLLEAAHAGWAGGFPLQREVYALVAAVLLGMTRLDALDLDAEPQPPDGKLGKVEERIGAGEGDTIVGADSAWQAALAKELLEGGTLLFVVSVMAKTRSHLTVSVRRRRPSLTSPVSGIRMRSNARQADWLRIDKASPSYSPNLADFGAGTTFWRGAVVAGVEGNQVRR